MVRRRVDGSEVRYCLQRRLRKPSAADVPEYLSDSDGVGLMAEVVLSRDEMETAITQIRPYISKVIRTIIKTSGRRGMQFEDCVQDVLVTIIEQWHTYSGPEAKRNEWFRRIIQESAESGRWNETAKRAVWHMAK